VHGPTPDVGEVVGIAAVAVAVVGGVVVVVGATVEDVDEAILVVPDEPHPSATTPAIGIRAATATRFTMGIYPSRPGNALPA
jgi:branched-subunit amino acid ABC-type transport system permease component